MPEPRPKFIVESRAGMPPRQQEARQHQAEEDIPDELRIPESPFTDRDDFVAQYGYVEFDPRYRYIREQQAVELLQMPTTEYTDPKLRLAHYRFKSLFPEGAQVAESGYITDTSGRQYLPSAMLPNDDMLDTRARRIFSEQYQADSTTYYHAERVRVHDDPMQDPAVASFINAALSHVEVEFRFLNDNTPQARHTALRKRIVEKIREWTTYKLEKAAAYAAKETDDPVLQVFIEALRQDLQERAEFSGEQRFIKIAPRAVDIANDDTRTNTIQTSVFVDGEWAVYPDRHKPPRIFTESEGLKDLITFLDRVERKASEVGDNELRNLVVAMREHIAFIGDREFIEATDAIAQRMIDMINTGKQVYVDLIKLRSERYTCLRILESFHALTEDVPELRRNVKLGRAWEVAEACADNIANSHIVVPDDFGVSGNRISGATFLMQDELRKCGISANDALRSIEATLIAMPQEIVQGRLEVRDQLFNLFAYYGVPEYRDPTGVQYVFTGVSMSGAHCSVDYGFETELDRMYRFMKDHGESVDVPLLAHIKRPYESAPHASEHFANPDLQARWDTMVETYGLDTYKSKKRSTDEAIARQNAGETN